MRASGKKLRKLNGWTYQVVDDNRDESKNPLEWRRSYNTIVLELRNHTFTDSYEVNSVEFNFRRIDDPEREHHDTVKGAPEHSVDINSVVDPDDLKDRLFFGEKTDEKDVIVLRTPRGPLNVTLRPGRGIDREEINAEGVYWGNIGHSDLEPGEDDIWLDVSIPKEQFEAITRRINKQPNIITRLVIAVRSFTYEVDDALGEPWYPQNIFISDQVDIAFLRSVSQYEPPVELKSSDAEEVTTKDDHSEFDDEESPTLAQRYSQGFEDFAKGLTHTSGWVLAWSGASSLIVLGITILLLLSEQFIGAGLFAIALTLMGLNYRLGKVLGSLPAFVAHKVALDAAKVDEASEKKD